MHVTEVVGDITEQDVQVIVNAWNRNIIPWWLLVPQGVSRTIKRKAGLKPFREVAQRGAIPLGQARVTGAGNLPCEAIIHVAGINMLWVATRRSVRDSVVNAMAIVHERGWESVAFPLIGAGSGNRGKAWSRRVMLEAFDSVDSTALVLLVEYAR